MNKSKNVDQFFTLPNNMTAENKLSPSDVLIYLYLKSYDNPEHQCYPSLKRLSEDSEASINTIRTCISNLEKCGYIKIKKIGKRNYYYFNSTKSFEPFSKEFLNNKNITFKEKAYIAASQQYMFKDIESYGKMTFSRKELSNRLNISENSIYRYDNSLKNKGYLEELDTQIIDVETGCIKKEKLYKLKELGQAVVWKLSEHDKDIEKLKQDNKSKDKLISQLIERVERLEKSSHFIV